MNLDSLIRENIKNMVPYSSARDEYPGNNGIFLDANENPFGKYNRYPDPYQKYLKEKISKIKKIPVNKIFLGNGSDEIIDLVFRIFCHPTKDKVLTFYPTYKIYEVNANINDVKIIKIPLNKKFQINLELLKPYYNNPSFKVIFICSPNNPTANLFNIKSIEEILNNFHGIVVIDEAYIDFSNSLSLMYRLNEFSNMVILQTFSKAFGLANVRVGMAFTSEKIISYFNKIKHPYNISGINQQIVINRLSNYEKVLIEIKKIIHQRNYLIKELKKISKIKKIYPTNSNFILAEVYNADNIYHSLVKEKVIIRNQSNIIKECIRITVGNKKENNILLDLLNKL